ncbi:MAG: hypothetical protein J3R72DRAFT_494317 [Linnemannia gamsii]|nr:MAG: hypothetical protein J3R72DRAFT_494317 [Linnemannia gamsii]
MVYMGKNYDPNYYKKFATTDPYSSSNPPPPPARRTYGSPPSRTPSIDDGSSRSTRSFSRPRLEDSVDRRPDRYRNWDKAWERNSRERSASRPYDNTLPPPPPPPAARGRYDNAPPPSRHREVKQEPECSSSTGTSNKRERDSMEGEGGSLKDVSGSSSKSNNKGIDNANNTTSKTSSKTSTTSSSTSTSVSEKSQSCKATPNKRSKVEDHLKRSPQDVQAHANAREIFGEETLHKVADNRERSRNSSDKLQKDDANIKNRTNPQQQHQQQQHQQQHQQQSSLSNSALAPAPITTPDNYQEQQQQQQQQQKHLNTTDKQYNTSDRIDLPHLQIRQNSVATTTSTIYHQNSWIRSPSTLSTTSSPFPSPASSTTTVDTHPGPSLDLAPHQGQQQPFKWLGDCSETGIEPTRPGPLMEQAPSTSEQQHRQQQQQQHPEPSSPLQQQPQYNDILTMTPSLILQAVDDKINYLDNLWRSGSDKLSQTAKVTEQGVLTCVLHQVLEDFRVYADLREMLQNQDVNGQMGAIETLHETMRQLETRRKYDFECLLPGVSIPEIPIDGSIPPAFVDVNISHLAASSNNYNGNGDKPTTTTVSTTEAAPSSAELQQQSLISSDKQTNPTTTQDNPRTRPLSSKETESSQNKTTIQSHEGDITNQRLPSSVDQHSSPSTNTGSGGGGLDKPAGTDAVHPSTLNITTSSTTTVPTTTTSSTVQESGSVTSKSIANAKAKATADNLTTTPPPPPPSSSKPAVTAVGNNSAYVLVKTTKWDKKNTDTATDQSTFPNAQLDHTSSTATSTTTTVTTPLDANAGLLPAPGPGAPTTATAPMTSSALGNRHAMMDIEQELRRIRQEGQEQRLRTDQLLAQLESEARLRREADSRVAQLSRDLQNERLLTLEKDLESKRSEALLMMAKAREEIQHGKILIAQAKEELAVERAAKAEAMVETARIQVERNRLLEVIQSLGGSSLPGSGNVGAQHRQE